MLVLKAQFVDRLRNLLFVPGDRPLMASGRAPVGDCDGSVARGLPDEDGPGRPG